MDCISLSPSSWGNEGLSGVLVKPTGKADAITHLNFHCYVGNNYLVNWARAAGTAPECCNNRRWKRIEFELFAHFHLGALQTQSHRLRLPLGLVDKDAQSYYEPMNYQDIITIEPGKRGGKPCIRGMRITVYDVLEYLASGMSQQEVLQEFPYLTEEDIRACFAYAADREKHLLVVTE